MQLMVLAEAKGGVAVYCCSLTSCTDIQTIFTDVLLSKFSARLCLMLAGCKPWQA